MENDNLDDLKKPISQLAKPKAADKPKVIKTKPTEPKPILEGINNTPKNTNDVVFVKPNPAPTAQLTEQEKMLVSEPMVIPEEDPEPKLMPESVISRSTKKTSSIKGVVTTGLVLLVIVVGGYMFYLWSLNKASNAPITTGSISNSMQPGSGPVITPDSTSTPSTSTPDVIASTTPDASPTSTPPVAPVTQLKINSTPTGYLNVRNTPSSSGKILTQVHPGEVYVYTATQTGWYEITLNDGTWAGLAPST